MTSLREMLDQQAKDKANAATNNTRPVETKGVGTSGQAKPSILAGLGKAKTTAETASNGSRHVTGDGGNSAIGATKHGEENRAASSNQPVQPALVKPATNGILARLQKTSGGSNGANQTAGAATIPATETKTISQTSEPTVTIEPKTLDPIPQPQLVAPEQAIEIEELRKNLAYLKANIDDKDLIRPVIGNICTKIQRNPELAVFVPNSDINALVAGLRKSYKYEVRKSEERKDTKSKSTAKADKFTQMMGDAGFGDIKL